MWFQLKALKGCMKLLDLGFDVAGPKNIIYKNIDLKEANKLVIFPSSILRIENSAK